MNYVNYFQYFKLYMWLPIIINNINTNIDCTFCHVGRSGREGVRDFINLRLALFFTATLLLRQKCQYNSCNK